MELTGAEALRSRYEYMFWDAVRMHNESAREQGFSLITTSNARRLRREFSAALGGRAKGLDSVGQAINDTLATAGADPIYRLPVESDATFKRQMQEWESITGFDGTDPDMMHFYPVSPYDPRFSDRQSILLSGSDLSFVSSDDFDDPKELIQPSRGLNIVVWRRPFGSGVDAPMAESDDMLTSISDETGLTRLAPYMSESEYHKCAGWVNAGWSRLNPDSEGYDASVKQRRAQLDRSVAILDALRDSGIAYTIQKDANPGQIKACIDGTNVEVRITDTIENQEYIGRVFDNGVQIHYMTSLQRQNRFQPYTQATPEQTVDLVKYALNEPVARWDDPSLGVGEQSDFSIKVKNRQGKNVELALNGAHFSSGGVFCAAIGDMPNQPYGHKVLVRMDASDRRARHAFISDADAARAYIESSVASARENLTQAIDVDRIIAEAVMHEGEEDYYPRFSEDEAVASIQQQYWDLLKGYTDHILRPGRDRDEYMAALEEVGELQLGTPVEQGVFEQRMADLRFSGDPVEQIRAHAEASVDYMVGDVTPDAQGHTFNPDGVARYQSSSAGFFFNEASLVVALRKMSYDIDQLKGPERDLAYIKNQLIEFDLDSARPMATHDNAFVRSMHEEIVDSLRRSGCDVDDANVLIDDNGVVRYTASRIFKRTKDNCDIDVVTGEIGQIFAPDEMGVVETKFAGDENYKSVPGYEAYITHQKQGENKSVAERTRLKGYEQRMREQIRRTIRQDIVGAHQGGGQIGLPASLNGVYRRLFDKRYPLDFLERFEEQGMPREFVEDMIGTEARRVRYDNSLRDGSTVMADWRAQNMSSFDPANDNFDDPYVLTGGSNMSIMDASGDGYFDKVATAGGVNQGITRYLTEDAVVNADGSITPGAADGKCPLLAGELGRYMEFNPFDRQQMTVNNLLQASAVTEKVGIAQMTFGGWTFDDPIVVSREFAEAHGIRNEAGDYRSLVKGDKLSDLNGNKGVISLIVDRNMDIAEAEREGIAEQVEWFKKNPELDVVMAPFPSVSRFNGGSARELMEDVADLQSPYGDVVAGGIGHARLIVTDKSADAKTHAYSDDDVRAGRGRKASAQLAWALNSQNCSAIMREIYGPNNAAVSALREYMVACGMDMDETGRLHMGYEAHEGEERNFFEMPALSYNAKGVLQADKMRRQFITDIGLSGGFAQIPFELDFKAGGSTEELTQGGYQMPILSANLRTGQRLEDDRTIAHDYTRHYGTIFTEAVRWLDLESKKKSLVGDALSDAQARQDACHKRAQLAFDYIQDDIANRVFEGKHNIFRDKIMSRRMSNSSTAIWSADPRLDIDQIAMGPALAREMELDEDGYVLAWRDPVLRDSGVRYLRVKIDDSLTGVAINPVMDKCFDGDFDGDTIGLLKLKTKSAQTEAFNKLSVDANLLDKGMPKEDGLYPLNIQNSLDIKVAHSVNPDLRDEWDTITRFVNKLDAEVEDAYAMDASSAEDKAIKYRHVDALKDIRTQAISKISDYYRNCFAESCGAGVVSFDSIEAHLESLQEVCIDTGAKGSLGKLADYATYLGVDVRQSYDVRDGLRHDLLVVEDVYDHTRSTREDAYGTEYATAVKAFGTGVAGAFSQRGVKALRNECQKAVLELTYPVTQAILQAKHDPVDAKNRYELLISPVRKLWQGYKMEKQLDSDGNVSWGLAKDNSGSPYPATKDEWVHDFMEMYTGEGGLGVDVNPEHVNAVADALSSEDGIIQSIEEFGGRNGAVLDRLAYGGGFDGLVESAVRGEDLFEGKFGAMFAPSVIKDNKAVERLREESNFCADVAYKPIRKSDTKLKPNNPRRRVVDVRLQQWAEMLEQLDGGDSVEAQDAAMSL